MNLWWIWMIFAAIFVIGEIFTAGFFLFWFGVGSVAAGIIAYVGLGAGWQWASFVIVSGILFAVSRRFAERFSKTQPPGIGADRFIGLEGIVLEEIDNFQNTGRIRVGKDEWRADSGTGNNIPIGKRVVVTRVEGTHLVVREAEEEK